MMEKGSMRIVKKIIGVLLLVAGGGMILMPDQVVPVLCANKIPFGILIVISGIFHLMSGRQS